MFSTFNCTVNSNVVLVHATKAQRGSSDTAALFLILGNQRRPVVNIMP